jgi:hypothetical protein
VKMASCPGQALAMHLPSVTCSGQVPWKLDVVSSSASLDANPRWSTSLAWVKCHVAAARAD